MDRWQLKQTKLFTRRRMLAATVAGAAAIGLYTWRVEPHWLQVVRRTLPIRNLPATLEGVTLAQLSDLHVGPQVSDSYLLNVFERIRKLSPQIVVYTGDFISNNTDLEHHAPRVISRLVCGTLGTFGVLGNHDYGFQWSNVKSANMVTSLAESVGVRILRNETANVNGLKIVGFDDLWAGRFAPRDVIRSLTPESPALALVHNPDAVDGSGWNDYSGWILSGHTHGGQCKPPFLPPPLLPVRNRQYTCGEFDLSGGRRLYISRGIGHLMRVRFNVRPEVTLFTLTQETT